MLWASRSASLTGDILLDLVELSVQPYRDLIDLLKFSPNGPLGPVGRGRWEIFRNSSSWMSGTVELLAGNLKLSLEGTARGMGRRDSRGMLPQSGKLDPCSWSMFRICR